MKRSGRKRLAVDLPQVLHDELRKIATHHHCTITMVVLRFLVEKALEERKRHESANNSGNNNSDLTDLFIF